MKLFATTSAVLLTAALASAEPPSSTQTGSEYGKPATTGEKDKTKNKMAFKAEVVSTDAAAKTITLRRTAGDTSGDTGSGTGSESGSMGSMSPMTYSVDTSAENSLTTVSAGDQVKVQLKKDSSGKEIVSKIDRVDTRPAGDRPPSP